VSTLIEKERERWGSRLGIIFAAAGSAVGIGNLLRFPGQAANNGGGAFMIPYVVSLLLFGLPIMWIAWTIGRHGGRYGHGTTPGMFDRLTNGRPWAKYAGVIGVALPLVFVVYYTYIEAWCLGYAFFSLTGRYVAPTTDLDVFFGEFLGDAPTRNYFGGLGWAVLFLVIALGLNVWVLYRGVSRGIEVLAKIAIPLLILFCVVLGVWVLGHGSEAWAGLDFLWTPNLSALRDPSIWMAAAGQVFFTLTIGYGALECFGSYVRDEDDIVLTGLTASSLNEVVEVVFGSMIAIPAAALYFGRENIAEVASGGTFAIGMISMPEIFRGMGGVQVFGSIWFLLLFFAAFTSSVAVAQPVMAFLQDEVRMSRGRAALLLLGLWGVGSIPVVLFYKYGALDEMDFWAGTIGLVVFSTIEAILFAWIFGIDRGWEEMHRGADLRVPVVFRFVMKYVTPVLLVSILAFWLWDAIVHDKLVPRPTVHVGFQKIGDERGRFVFDRPEPGTADAKELERLEKRLVALAERKGNDITLVFDRLAVHTSAPARPVVGRVEGAELEEISTAEAVRLVNLLGPTYERARGENLRTREVTLIYEVRSRSFAIWTVRILMILVNVGFIVLIYRAWSRRGPRPEEATT
jgi:SNF family Na+-dependent transporter